MTTGGRNIAQWPASIRFKIHGAAVCAWLTPSIDKEVFGGCLSQGYLVVAAEGGVRGGPRIPSWIEEAFKVEAVDTSFLVVVKPVACCADDKRRTTSEKKFILDWIIF